MKYLILSFFLFIQFSCTCDFYLSQLEKKGCLKDSVQIDTVFYNREITVKLPSDTINQTITLIDSFGIPLDFKYHEFRRGILHASIEIIKGQMNLKIWGDTVYKTLIKDQIIYKDNTKIISTNPGLWKSVKKYSLFLLVYTLSLILIFSFVFRR